MHLLINYHMSGVKIKLVIRINSLDLLKGTISLYMQYLLRASNQRLIIDVTQVTIIAFMNTSLKES